MAQPDHLRRLSLSPEEAFVCSRVNRPTRVREVIFGSGLPESSARPILLALLEKRALVVSKGTETTGSRLPIGPRPAAPLSSSPSTERRPSHSTRPVAATRPPPAKPRLPTSPPRPSAPPRPSTPPPRTPTTASRPPASRDRSGPASTGASPDPIDYGDFKFPQDELNEDVELELEKRKEILFLYYQREAISHFRLLGVSPTATSAEIRKAYLERSKEFHPDKFFRKRLGTYLSKIQDVFNRLRIAEETLSDPASRRRYEREAANKFTAKERAALILREVEQIESEKRLRERRERLLRSRGFARLSKARELMQAGDALFASGKEKEALEKFRHALELDPKLELARERIVEARRNADVKRAAQSIEKAREQERMGRPKAAVALLKSAIEVDDASASARLELAGVLFRSGLDLRDARIHIQRAIAQGLSTPDAHRLHGEILLALGLKRDARRELELAEKRGDSRARQLLNGM